LVAQSLAFLIFDGDVLMVLRNRVGLAGKAGLELAWESGAAPSGQKKPYTKRDPKSLISKYSSNTGSNQTNLPSK
jgi:hypothetical protein